MCALAPSPAAATITVGELFSPTFKTCTPGTLLQTGSSATTYTIPAVGTITSWSFQTNENAVPGLKLKVARPAGGNTYTIVGESAAGTLSASAVNAAATAIAVEPGDIIGVYEGGGGCISTTGAASDTYAWTVSHDELLNATSAYEPLTGARVPLAVVETVPPGATTTPPSAIGANAATLNGTVGAETSRTAYFQYGATAAYGLATAHQSLGPGGDASVSATTDGLSPGTAYHFRLVAENAGGVTYGADESFVTPQPPATVVAALAPPVASAKPRVHLRTGEISSEYTFSGPGLAVESAEVLGRASLSGCKGHRAAKRRRCIGNAPLSYGRESLVVPRAGAYRFLIEPSVRALAALKRGRVLRVRLTLVFTPTGSARHTTETADLEVRVKRARHGSKDSSKRPPS